MAVVHVEELSKTFFVPEREPGLAAAFRMWMSPAVAYRVSGTTGLDALRIVGPELLP